MKNINIFLFLFVAIMFVFQSCTEDVIIGEELVLEKKSGYATINSEQLFRQSLRSLITQFNTSNAASNGTFENLLRSLKDKSKNDALQALGSSGLIDVVLLENTINNTNVYTSNLVSVYGEQYVKDIVDQETGGLQTMGNPFWGVGEDPECIPGSETEIHGGVSDGGCFYYCRAKFYCFWICWGGSATIEKKIEC